MPYKVTKRDGKWAVHKEGADGQPMGDALGMHDSEDEAMAQMRALYAAEGKKTAPAVKFAEGSEVDLSGLLAPHGGSFNGRDIAGEFFSAKTDFVLDLINGDRPLLFQHGLDIKAGLAVVGRIKALSRDEAGLWMKAQLDAASDYYGAIKELVKQGKLGLSSGSMRHLVQMGKSGEILRWPLIEGSLTPTPCNPLAEVAFSAVKSHFASIGGELPAGLTPPADLPTLIATALDDEGAFAKAFLDVPLTDHADYLQAIAASLGERTKDLTERRTKEGRVISSSNRKRLSECVASMRQATDDLAALLDSTDPAKVEAKAVRVRRARAQAQAFWLQALSN